MFNLKDYILEYLSPSSDNENKDASAVVCLILSGQEILFIKRSEEVPTYKGDIAFIGGHIAPNETPLAAALREFEEESSMSKDSLNYLGMLNSVHTSSSTKVAVCCFDLKMKKDIFLKDVSSNGEWESIFFVDKQHFIRKSHWSYAELIRADRYGQIFFCEMGERSKNLWGMTASIIMGIFKNKLK